jgi:aspartate-semialdehyde dehydrogenase
VRVPVLVGHAQSVWVETEEPLSPEQAEAVLAAAPSVRLVETPTPRAAALTEDVLVGRVRPDLAAESNGIVLLLACDNLVKGAALNALQIAELLLEPARAAA